MFHLYFQLSQLIVNAGGSGRGRRLRPHLGCVLQKGPQCPESLSYQKKDGRAGPRPPFFWYDTDFSKKKSKKKKNQKFKKKKKARQTFFWYDNDSGPKGPFRVMQPTYVSLLFPAITANS